VYELVLAVTSPSRLDVCLGEVSAGEPDCTTPVVPCSLLVVAFMQMEGEDKRGVRVEVAVYPMHEEAKSKGIGVREVEIVLRLGSFAPVEDDATDENRIIYSFLGEFASAQPNCPDLLAALPLRIDRNAQSATRTEAITDCIDLVVSENNVAAPIRHGGLCGRDQGDDLAVAQPMPPKGSGEIATF